MKRFLQERQDDPVNDAEIKAWLDVAKHWAAAEHSPNDRVFTVEYCSGLCTLIRSWYPDYLIEIMLAKITILPNCDSMLHSGYKWSPYTEEGKQQRIAFCLEQAKLLEEKDAEIKAWLDLAEALQHAIRLACRWYTVDGLSGLCSLIRRRYPNVCFSMLNKINDLDDYSGYYSGYKWNPTTEEGRQQRIAFCLEQAKLLEGP